MAIDEKTLRLSTNPSVIATLILIDEIRQLKEVLSKDSNLVFLDSSVDKAVEVEVKKPRKPRSPNKPKGVDKRMVK